MSEVIEINDLHALEPYRLLWNSLLWQTPGASFFHTYDWLETYWRHFGQEQQLRVMIAHAGGQPIGIAAFCVRPRSHRLGKVRVLGFPLDDWGSWYGSIGPNPTATMMLVMQHIRRSRRNWDMIELDWNGPTDWDRGRPGRAMRIAGYSPHKQLNRSTSVVEFQGTWKSYLAHRPAKKRHEMRRKLRRLGERDDVQFIRHRPLAASAGDGDPRWDLYESCAQVAAESWQAGRADGNTLSSRRVEAFLRDAHDVAARRGMVDMNLLLVDSEPAAFAYNYHLDGRLYGLRIGFAARFRSLGVGTGLLLESIRDSFERGDRQLDLGEGDWRFKRELRTRTATGYRLTYAPMVCWRSQAVQIADWAKSRFGSPASPLSKRASA